MHNTHATTVLKNLHTVFENDIQGNFLELQ